MYLMEGRKLLDAQLFNRTAEIAKTIVINFFVDFREFYCFSQFHTYLDLKSIGSTSFCRKNDSQFDRQ